MTNRIDDLHGGVILYIKDLLFYKRRFDLEPINTDCLWVEIIFSQTKHILFGVFIEPPMQMHFTQILLGILLTLDTNIIDIIVTGDFNFNP
jgi:hypothetical protein